MQRKYDYYFSLQLNKKPRRKVSLLPVLVLLFLALLVYGLFEFSDSLNRTVEGKVKLEQLRKEEEKRKDEEEKRKLQEEIKKKDQNIQDLEKALQAKRAEQARLAGLPPSRGEIVNEIYAVFGKVRGQAFIYVLRECRENSTLDPTAVNVNTNGSKDIGVGQVNAPGGFRQGYNEEQLKDFRINIRVSYAIYKSQGWRAWYGCRDRGLPYPTV